eukprot:1190020-Prorocentrum_minimum.AAC.2
MIMSIGVPVWALRLFLGRYNRPYCSCYAEYRSNDALVDTPYNTLVRTTTALKSVLSICSVLSDVRTRIVSKKRQRFERVEDSTRFRIISRERVRQIPVNVRGVLKKSFGRRPRDAPDDIVRLVFVARLQLDVVHRPVRPLCRPAPAYLLRYDRVTRAEAGAGGVTRGRSDCVTRADEEVVPI